MVPDDLLLSETDRIAWRLAAGPAMAQAQIKSLITGSLDNDLASQQAAEA